MTKIIAAVGKCVNAPKKKVNESYSQFDIPMCLHFLFFYEFQLFCSKKNWCFNKYFATLEGLEYDISSNSLSKHLLLLPDFN
jgi:hypothetical protein